MSWRLSWPLVGALAACGGGQGEVVAPQASPIEVEAELAEPAPTMVAAPVQQATEPTGQASEAPDEEDGPSEPIAHGGSPKSSTSAAPLKQGSGSGTGIEACDDYLDYLQRCVGALVKVGGNDVFKALEQTIVNQRTDFRNVAKNAPDAATLEAMSAGCQASLDSLKQMGPNCGMPVPP